jgi:enoyl-CoA hydratase/carnithine racemase
MAGEIAARSPEAVRAAKSLLNRAGLVGLEEGLLLEEKAQASLIGTPNQIEAVRANMEKREPRFDDPC